MPRHAARREPCVLLALCSLTGDSVRVPPASVPRERVTSHDFVFLMCYEYDSIYKYVRATAIYFYTDYCTYSSRNPRAAPRGMVHDVSTEFTAKATKRPGRPRARAYTRTPHESCHLTHLVHSSQFLSQIISCPRLHSSATVTHATSNAATANATHH